MPHRVVPARLALGVAGFLALALLVAPSAAAGPAGGGALSIGPAAAPARAAAGPTRRAALGVAAVPSVPEPTDVERAAELHALALIADARAAAGLGGLRTDADLEAIARARALDMRDRHYFAHTAPDGRTAFDMLDAADIAWSSGSEVIGWNDELSADASAARVVAAWLASPPHEQVLLAADSDRIGLASAYDPASGRRIWVAILVVTADRTPPVAAVRVISTGRRDATGHRRVTVAWIAHDVAGSGAETGIRDVTVQLRVASGPWRTVSRNTAGSSLRLRLAADQPAAVRVRPRDRAGNLGAWASVSIAP